MNPRDENGDTLFITCASGLPFPLEDPSHQDFTIQDIAHHLSRLNRYTGAITPEHYSVAEHSVRVAHYLHALVAREMPGHDLDRAFKLGLMHDAHEAYLNDMSSPLKRVLKRRGSTAYIMLAEHYDRLLMERFDLFPGLVPLDLVREADLSLLDLERPKLFPKGMAFRPCGQLPKVELPDLGPWGWRPNLARSRFLRAAKSVGLL